MSDYGDFCRDQRERANERARKHSKLCWNCGARVWNYEPECFKCKTANADYKPKKVLCGRDVK